MTQKIEAGGFRFVTEARLVRDETLHGVFHVLSFGDAEIFEPPVVVIVPGKWSSEDDAHRAAQDYATVMAADGALRQAIDLRQLACR